MKTIDIKNVKKGMTVQVWWPNSETYLTVQVVKVGKNKALGHYFVWTEDINWWRGQYDEAYAAKFPVLEA